MHHIKVLSQQMFKGGGHSYFSGEVHVFKIMRPLQAFTNSSEAFKNQFCPKKQGNKTILKRAGQQNREVSPKNMRVPCPLFLL